MHWADLVFVMEHNQWAKIWSLYKNIELPAIEILNIPGDYEFMSDELIDLLTGRINEALERVFKN